PLPTSTGLHLVVDARVSVDPASESGIAIPDSAVDRAVDRLRAEPLGRQEVLHHLRALSQVHERVLLGVVQLQHAGVPARQALGGLHGRLFGLGRNVPVDVASEPGVGVGLVVARHHFLLRPHHTITRSRQPSASSVTDITPGADSAPEMLRNHELPLSDVGAMNIHRSSPQVCTRRLWKCPKIARSACPIGVRPAACPANHLPSWSGLRTWCPCATPSTLPPTAWMATDSLCCSGA